jgi:hypothetical protein
MAAEWRELGFKVSIDDVPYEFRRIGDQMMRISRS